MRATDEVGWVRVWLDEEGQPPITLIYCPRCAEQFGAYPEDVSAMRALRKSWTPIAAFEPGFASRHLDQLTCLARLTLPRSEDLRVVAPASLAAVGFGAAAAHAGHWPDIFF